MSRPGFIPGLLVATSSQTRLRDSQSLVTEWLDSGYLLGIGVAGAILIVLGLKRDDAVGPIFLIAGLALAAFGFGSHFLGWKF